jgi:NTP pyrophosphatase (non-canonical NTP hydrolase)
MISITALQSAVAVWLARNFPDRNPLTAVGGTAEEVGELCRAAVKLDQGIRGTEAEWLAEIDKELGDVFIKLCDVADWYGRDLEAAIAARWETVRTRDWQADKLGHGRPDDDAAACPDCLGDPNTVCDACHLHACWCGKLMCGEVQTAGTRQADRSRKARR